MKERDLYAAGQLYDAKNVFGDWYDIDDLKYNSLIRKLILFCIFF